MVAYLQKSEGSEGFHQIIDFLNASHIQYALTENPTIYVSFIKQFWRTATARTSANGEVELTATIDGQVKTITEASLRRHLKLEDNGGVTTLPNSEIFEQLALMGYVTDSDKLTFQKGHFSPQWKFLIHTILHCLSPKKTAWEQFSSNIATAIICLATNRTYNFSKLIFDAMIKNLENPHKFLMYPRFLQICFNKQRRLLQPHTQTYPTPILTQKVFSNMKRVSRGYSGIDFSLFPTMISAPETSPSRITSSPSLSPQHTPVYVDDIIFGSTKKKLCLEFKKLMHDKFQMSSMGELTFFLGLQVKQKEDGIFISQDKYVTDILKKFSFQDVRTDSTPMDTKKSLHKDSDGDDVDVYLYSDYAEVSLDRKFNLQEVVSSLDEIVIMAVQDANLRLPNSSTKAEYVVLLVALEMYSSSELNAGIGQKITTARKKLLLLGAKVTLLRKFLSLEALFEGRILIYTIKEWMEGYVGDEAVHKELGDRMERAATTTSSLEAEFETTSKQSYDPPLSRGYTLGSGEDSLKLLELMELCTTATAKAQTVNGVRQIQAIIDKMKLIITETSIRSDLHLEDAGGTDCLPTTTIFEELA
ncbi:putative ribonuclease H-like domain-containing protein [Tanacetum coccineum]